MRAVALAFILCLLALLFAPAVHADSIAHAGRDWITISPLPCTDPTVLALLEQAGQDVHDWRSAAAEFGGHAFAACWRADFAQQRVLLRFDDGDQGMVPFGALKPLREA